MPCNTCDDRIVSIERGGVELVFSYVDCVRIAQTGKVAAQADAME